MNQNIYLYSKWKAYSTKLNPLSILFLIVIFCIATQAPVLAQVRVGGGTIRIDASPASDKEKSKDSEKEGPVRPLPAQASAQIKKLALVERKKRMDFMAVVIDDVARLCELNEDQKERLTLAASGASERSMKKWHEQAANYFSSRLKGATKDTAKEVLASMGNVNFGGRNGEKESESEDIWKDTLNEVLSPEQVKQYEELVERRKQDRVNAYSQISLASIDNFLRLTPDQREKIGAIVKSSTTQYIDEVQRYWGNYFENGMLMSLINASDEEDLKKILTERQYDRHRTATSNFDHFWDQKRKLRKAQVKAAEVRKQKEEEKKAAAEKKDDTKKKD